MAHILSISGMHVGLIALALELVLGLMRVPPRHSHLIALCVIVVYVAMLGAPAPAMRAATMLAARSFSKVSQRPTSPWTLLAIGSVEPIFWPRVATEVGFQLSVVGVASLIASGALLDRLGLTEGPAWRRELLAGVAGSTLATIATAPLVIWWFGRVSIVGPLANIFAAPIIGVLQPMLFLSLVLSPVPGLASFVADSAHPLMVALEAVATRSSEMPWATVGTWATPMTAALMGIASVAVIAGCIARRPERAMMVCVAAVALLAWQPSLPGFGRVTELHLIDVGQGDALALRTSRGRWVVFDAGRAWGRDDAGRRTVVPYIARRGGRVHAFVLSHPHSDHVGGAASVVEALKPQRYLDAAFAAPNQAYLASLLAARRVATQWSRVHPGDTLAVDEALVTFLAPDSAWTVSLRDANDASTVALVQIGRVRILLVGDAEAEEERWMVDRWGDALGADVLKVGHHGSSTSSTAEFLDAVRPRVALISVGAGNRYGHPSPGVLAALGARDVMVIRTDLSGTTVIRTDGRTLAMDVDGERIFLR
jgi:competence protein ComEC